MHHGVGTVKRLGVGPSAWIEAPPLDLPRRPLRLRRPPQRDNARASARKLLDEPAPDKSRGSGYRNRSSHAGKCTQKLALDAALSNVNAAFYASARDFSLRPMGYEAAVAR